MRLATLRVSGFKSFAEPVTLRFSVGVTGMVGPNGCGKSNLVDALRWTLGESRASSLRGEALSDVLFKGGGGLPAAAICSVELRFVNDGGRDLGIWKECAEIVVRRQFDSEGASSYSINGQGARRRDVADLFHGTGVSSRAYGVVEQGMIGHLVDASPEQLRAFWKKPPMFRATASGGANRSGGWRAAATIWRESPNSRANPKSDSRRCGGNRGRRSGISNARAKLTNDTRFCCRGGSRRPMRGCARGRRKSTNHKSRRSRARARDASRSRRRQSAQRRGRRRRSSRARARSSRAKRGKANRWPPRIGFYRRDAGALRAAIAKRPRRIDGGGKRSAGGRDDERDNRRRRRKRAAKTRASRQRFARRKRGANGGGSGANGGANGGGSGARRIIENRARNRARKNAGAIARRRKPRGCNPKSKRRQPPSRARPKRKATTASASGSKRAAAKPRRRKKKPAPPRTRWPRRGKRTTKTSARRAPRRTPKKPPPPNAKG